MKTLLVSFFALWLGLNIVLGLTLLFVSRAKVVVRWYDGWVGFFWSRKDKQLYVFLQPFVGWKINCCPHVKNEVYQQMVDSKYYKKCKVCGTVKQIHA